MVFNDLRYFHKYFENLFDPLREKEKSSVTIFALAKKSRFDDLLMIVSRAIFV